ncbi:MAG: SRPBCC family protein [Gemmatimonadaceae bacterium]|nr:SRPBCC family protein [Gemmatimonadaceae bacterium]
MRIVLGIVGALIAIVLVTGIIAVLVGRRLPERHTATVTRDIPVPLSRVASIVRDIEAQPSWRAGLKRIVVTERPAGALRYVEHGSNGEIPFVFREVVPDREFTSVIDTDALPFGGEWTFTLTPLDSARTQVTIREDGVVRSALFRFVSTYIMGHTRTIDGYLDDLAAAAPR